ncbi:Ca-activated chloride channel homolog [Gammaproteobacteria bacterium]
MIEFQWPWYLLLLPVPLLLRRWWHSATAVEQAALRVPTLESFSIAADGSTFGHRRTDRRLLWGAALAWLLLVLAVARPVWLGDAIELPVSGRDLMLAVDLSGSMETADFLLDDHPVDRLTAIKHVAGKFIEQRVGDRLGLILFGRQAYVQTPLTFDRATVRQLLDEAAIGLAGKETAIGDAIGLATKRLRDDPQGNKVVILLTDGANTAGEVEPLQAATLAAKEGLTIYTIGVGADEMLVRSLFGTQRVNPSADLDERTLRTIAESTHGRYFRARDSAQLEEIYQLLDQLEPTSAERHTFRPLQSLFYWPLAAALLLAALVVWVRSGKFSQLAIWPTGKTRIKPNRAKWPESIAKWLKLAKWSVMRSMRSM